MADSREGKAKPVIVTVNGIRVAAFSGQSVQAVLLAAGYRRLGRSPRLKEPRSGFCGMGVCYECLVSIDSRPNQRACMRTVEESMEIEIDAD